MHSAYYKDIRINPCLKVTGCLSDFRKVSRNRLLNNCLKQIIHISFLFKTKITIVGSTSLSIPSSAPRWPVLW